jgi:uncharacterized membrane protein
MDREIVIVVPTEAQAYGVVKALEALDDEGSIELYSSTVVAKSAEGDVQIKDARDLRGPVGTALGLSAGALIGLLGGPVGAAMGAAIGGVAGLGGDLAYSGFSGDFVQEVSTQLRPGAYAVCVSVWEDWKVPIDAAVLPFGGAVFRQSTEDMIVTQIRGEMQALEDEQDHLDDEIARKTGEAKAKLEAKREELRSKQEARRERLQQRAQELQTDWDAKIASIKAKAASAKADARTRHQRHMEKLDRFAAEQKQSFKQLFD